MDQLRHGESIANTDNTTGRAILKVSVCKAIQKRCAWIGGLRIPRAESHDAWLYFEVLQMKEGELTLKTEEKPLSGHGMLRVEKLICRSWLATLSAVTLTSGATGELSECQQVHRTLSISD